MKKLSIIILVTLFSLPSFAETLYGHAKDRDSGLFYSLIKRSGYQNVSHIKLGKPEGWKKAVSDTFNGTFHAMVMQSYASYKVTFLSDGSAYECHGQRVMNFHRKKVALSNCKKINDKAADKSEMFETNESDLDLGESAP